MTMLKITALRKRRGWSQSELARRAKIHPSTVSQLETGALRPGPLSTSLVALARPLGLKSEDAGSLLDEVSNA